MHCDHFRAGECRSCTLLDVPQEEQVRAAQQAVQELLTPEAVRDGSAAGIWGPPVRSAPARFRARAKMVVTGTAMEPVLGLAEDVSPLPADLSDCPLYPAGVEELLVGVKALIRRAQLPPYDVPRRRGELKHVIVTASPDGEHMLRLVLRSESALPRVREHLPALLASSPGLRVVSANIHPEHSALLEGPTEIHLAGEASLPLRLGESGIVLLARPQSFLQTNTEVASQLYAQAGAWVDEIDASRTPGAPPLRLWDLYCGIGGFALHVARPGGSGAREVTGVEISEQAVVSARESAVLAGLEAQFLADDATDWAIRGEQPPDVVIVNPPRRGLGERLAAWIEGSGMPDVLYSSCNPASLARDLRAMPSYRIIAGRLVEMFPHTRHDEVIVRLHRA